MSAPATSCHLSPKAVSKKAGPEIKDTEIQCMLLEAVPNSLGNERFCRVCGGKFDTDSRAKQKLWIGCDIQECDYWLHAFCLLGNSAKITAKFVKSLPYTCPMHR